MMNMNLSSFQKSATRPRQLAVFINYFHFMPLPIHNHVELMFDVDCRDRMLNRYEFHSHLRNTGYLFC